jgi:hypothetical protein
VLGYSFPRRRGDFQVSDQVIQVYEFEGEMCRRVREYYDRDAALSSIRGDRTGASS